MGEILRAPRGTNDILPPQTLQWSSVEGIMRSFAERYGYLEIRTPIFEHTELFARGVGEGTDIVSKEMYTFLDKGERSLTLRPEMTASAVRAYLEHSFTRQPLVKWYYIGPGFRYERPQSGRFRQFYQFGVEAIGSLNPSLDAETIGLAFELFADLGLKNLEVKLNSIGCNVCRPEYRKLLQRYFLPYREQLCRDCQTYRLEKNPLRLLDCKIPSCRPFIEKAPMPNKHLCEECQTHFQKVQDRLKSAGIPFSLDPYLVRGLEYYTKTVFEVISSSLGSQNSLCGGGRYDNLVEALGGPSRPAVGFAAGINRIVMLLSNEGADAPRMKVDLFIAPLGDQAEAYLFPIVIRLRRRGLSVYWNFQEKSLAAQLKEADQLQAPWALILGENELAENKGILRNMKTRTQDIVPLGLLEERIIRLLRHEKVAAQ